MEDDEILREVRAIREAYAEHFGYDIEAIFLDAKSRDGRDGRQVVHLEPRLLEPGVGETAEDEGA